ncbi:MAG: hypothetical protein ACKVHE_31295 [Planctomycetales bacterium]|jgi:hypothetical protein
MHPKPKGNRTPRDGTSALQLAVESGHFELPLMLVQQGADPAVWNQKNKHGWTPEMITSGKRPGSFKPSPVTIRAPRAPVAGFAK